MTSEKMLTVTAMAKSYGVVRALRGVDLELNKHEVHGLIGENGSGKSTLTSIVAGAQPPSSGTMQFRGRPWQPSSTNDALRHGIGMVVQESGTVPGVSVAENLFLGDTAQFARLGLVNRTAMNRRAREALVRVGVTDIDPATPTAALDLEARKLVELARVVMHQPDVVVVDETSTALSHEGREVLYRVIEQQRERGSVIFISHDLEEIMSVCDRLTVLRDGEMVRRFDKADFQEDAIRAAMIGRELEGEYYRTDAAPSAEPEVLLEARQLTVGDAVRNVSVSLHAGEIVGVGGLSSSGMHELGRALFGAVRADAGSVRAGGQRITNERLAVRAAIGYVSKDRDTESLSLTANIRDNIASAGLRLIGRGHGGLITRRAEDAYVRAPMAQLQIKATGPEQVVSTLSGGNKQKVVFGKWVANGTEILILDCPTRGVDVGVKQAMYQLMAELKAAGKAILLISEEMTELIGMSDRLLVMKDGRVAREFHRGPELNEMEIIQCMI